MGVCIHIYIYTHITIHILIKYINIYTGSKPPQ